jgi:hypothetical protein
MASPVVATTDTTAGTSSVSPGVSINMPASISAGDLLIAFCAGDTAVAYTAADWTNITDQANGTACQLTIFAKIAAGGDTMTLVGEANDYAVVTARITGHGVVSLANDIYKGTAATGSDAAPNPPTVTPPISADWLFLACFGADDDDIADPDTGYTGWSTNYSAGVAKRSATGTSSCCVAFGQRALTTGSAEDPGTMTMTAVEEWAAQTLAIPPTGFTLPATPVFRTETGSTGTGTSLAVAKPSGTTSGDLLILQICKEGGTTNTITASQWTLIREDAQSTNVTVTTYRRAENGDALSAVTLNSSAKYTWTVGRFDGHDAASPIDGSAGATAASGNADPPSVTPNVVNTLALIVSGNKGAPTGTPPAGYTERWDRANTVDGSTSNYGATKGLYTTSAEDPATITPSVATEWAAQTILLKPAPAAKSFPPFDERGRFTHLLVR